MMYCGKAGHAGLIDVGLSSCPTAEGFGDLFFVKLVNPKNPTSR